MSGQKDELVPNVRYDLSHFRPDSRDTLNEIMEAQERVTGERTGRFGSNSVLRVLKKRQPSGTPSTAQTSTSSTLEDPAGGSKEEIPNTEDTTPGSKPEPKGKPNE